MAEETTDSGTPDGADEPGEEQGTAPAPGLGLSAKSKDRIALAAVLLLVVCYFALFNTLSVMRYSNYRAPGIDIAIFNQVLWKMSHFKAPVSTIRGMNIFGDHMETILFLLVPFYWIKGSVYAILTLQTLALALGALALYLIARDRIESRWVPVVVATAYLCYPALQRLNLFDWHPETLGLCFLLFAILAVLKRRFFWFYVLCLLAALCKEDMALAVFFLAVVVYFKYDKRAGRNVFWASGVYFLVSVFAVIPAFGTEGFQYSGRLKQFGRTGFEAVRNMIIHPVRTFNILVTRVNVRYVFDLLFPAAFLCVLAPLFLLPALPAFFFNIVSDFPGQHTILFQYTAGIIPFVFVAVVFAIAKIMKWAEGSFRPRLIAGAVAFVLLASALAGTFYLGPSPVSEAWASSVYGSDPHVDVIRQGLETIPADARVSAQDYLLPHLSERDYLYMYPQPFIDLVDRDYYESLEPDERKFMWPGIYRRLQPGVDKSKYPVPRVDYVALDVGVDPWPLSRSEYDRMLRRLTTGGDFEMVFNRNGVLVLKKVRGRKPGG